MAKHGAKVTLLDYSSEALDRAKIFFKNNNLKATFVQGDAFNLPKEIKNKKFDVSVSIGLTEHFKGKKRVKIHKVHLDVLKKGGLTFISVPNKFNLPYRIYKSVSELTGTWKFGEEYPFSRSELINICERINGQFVEIFGDNLYKSIKFLLPANFLRRFFKVGTPRNKNEIRKENKTIFDKYLSYSLVLVMKKK
jgi:2-polyprenyl-3-methyl-5-hydroxy-6-metoxy-1,4-benzoquinol methylase